MATSKKEEKNTETEATKEPTVNEVRRKAFLKTLKEVDKIVNPSKKDKLLSLINDLHVEVKRFSSGSVVLDNISGGGFPHGRIIEIYGPEASGKTSIALNSIANVQREGGNCVFIDVEQALDTHYAKVLGVDLNELGFAQPSTAEETLRLCMGLAKSQTVDLIVVDSVAAMVPQQEIDGGIEKASVASLARLMSKGLRQLVDVCNKNNCTIIFLNQIRQKVGVMFGNPETTPGGQALKFFASQRIEIRRKGQVKEGDDVIGTEVRLKVIKNKVSAPYGQGATVLTFAHGINRAAEVFVVAEELGVINKSGNTYYYNPVDENKKLPEEVEALRTDNGIKLDVGKSKTIEVLSEKGIFYPLVKADMDKVLQGTITG